MTSPRLLNGLLIATCALLAVSLVGGRFPLEQSLQLLPTIGAIAALLIAARRNWLSRRAIICVILFLWLHILGARYIYSYVPYNDWLARVGLGTTRSWFGWERNHYDRFVHLCFGALGVPPAVEVAERYGGLPRRWAIIFGVCAVAMLGALYEIIEWVVAIVLSPQQAESYNGQQGDAWDAQKDQALAIAGSVMAALWLWLRKPVPTR